MTRQEENWEMMTLLRMPWEDANDISHDEDRAFLLEKCGQIKEYHEAAMKAEQEAHAAQAGGEDLRDEIKSQIITPSDNIITP